MMTMRKAAVYLDLRSTSIYNYLLGLFCFRAVGIISVVAHFLTIQLHLSKLELEKGLTKGDDKYRDMTKMSVD